MVYDEYFRPIPYTHVLAIGTGSGDVTDTLGIFSIYVRSNDQISFYNISFQDTARFISKDEKGFYIILRKKYYSLREARVYSWGSTYGEFLDEVKRMGDPVTKGEELGLPIQNPNYIPFEMDEKKLKSASFFLHSPISFFYYNMSRLEKGARKAYELEKDKALIDIFEETLGEENISYITGLEGEELEAFFIFLNTHMLCTYKCSEFQLLTEIYAIWDVYKER